MSAALVCSHHSSASAAAFAEQLPTIFEEFKLIISECVEEPSGLVAMLFGGAA